jgi:hypothetical protein
VAPVAQFSGCHCRDHGHNEHSDPDFAARHAVQPGRCDEEPGSVGHHGRRQGRKDQREAEQLGGPPPGLHQRHRRKRGAQERARGDGRLVQPGLRVHQGRNEHGTPCERRPPVRQERDDGRLETVRREGEVFRQGAQALRLPGFDQHGGQLRDRRLDARAAVGGVAAGDADVRLERGVKERLPVRRRGLGGAHVDDVRGLRVATPAAR